MMPARTLGDVGRKGIGLVDGTGEALDSRQLSLGLGVTATYAASTLRDLAVLARNLTSSSASGPEHHRDAYLSWVENAELQLRSLFASRWVWQDLYTDRYWHLRGIRQETPRPFPLVAMEASWQAERMNRLASRLEAEQQRYELPSDCLGIIVDTNVYVHYRRFDEVPWPQIAGVPTTRLLVPLLVLDELDELSYKSRATASRAAGVLRLFRTLLGDQTADAVPDIRAGVTAQFVIDPPGHQRRSNNDEELLDRAEYLVGILGDRVVVCTGDYGMQLRALSRDLRSLQPPDRLRLPSRSQSG
jgi:hypothetical protein